MDYGILGEVRVLRAGAPIPLGGPMATRLLAALLVDAPGGVERDVLIERLWGDSSAGDCDDGAPGPHRPPAAGAGTRSSRWALLGPSDHRGWVCAQDRSRLDRRRPFRVVAARAEERAEADPRGALGDVESARALWRGRPWGALADELWLRGDVARIEELRRRSDELWADVQLALGCHELSVDSI